MVLADPTLWVLDYYGCFHKCTFIVIPKKAGIYFL